MALSDIAAGIEVTTEQRDRGVASVDRTDESLADRLAGAAEDLPCDAETAATLVETYAAGESVGDAGQAADVAPITAAKTLHHVGEHVSPSRRPPVTSSGTGSTERSRGERSHRAHGCERTRVRTGRLRRDPRTLGRRPGRHRRVSDERRRHRRETGVARRVGGSGRRAAVVRTGAAGCASSSAGASRTAAGASRGRR